MSFLKQFTYEHVLVLGLAKSGTAAAELLLRHNKKVRVNDFRAQKTDAIVIDLQAKGAEVIVGDHPISALDGIDVVVKNPGIPYDNPIVKQAALQNIPIITEIEIASLLAENRHIIGITGSNGKTTTTMLVNEMLKASDVKVKLAGNIGIVATEVAQTLEDEEKLLLELSSFQLLGIENFHTHVAVLLNLYGAHLDYHGTVDAYESAKANIFRNQTAEDFLVYNADDPRVVNIVQDAKSILVPFSKEQKQPHGAWIDEEFMYFKAEKIIALEHILLVGDHNVENILAAVSAAILNGATIEGIQHVLKTFSGVEHRLEFVLELHGRSFYNDSKATNMLATQKALRSFTQPTILLAGGLDRGEDYTPMIPYLEHVKAVVLFGETKNKLAVTAKKAGITDIHFADDVKEAAKLAYQISAEGDIILLSPACASWDQYKTFEERGDMFTQSVHTLG